MAYFMNNCTSDLFSVLFEKLVREDDDMFVLKVAAIEGIRPGVVK